MEMRDVAAWRHLPARGRQQCLQNELIWFIYQVQSYQMNSVTVLQRKECLLIITMIIIIIIITITIITTIILSTKRITTIIITMITCEPPFILLRVYSEHQILTYDSKQFEKSWSTNTITSDIDNECNLIYSSIVTGHIFKVLVFSWGFPFYTVYNCTLLLHHTLHVYTAQYFYSTTHYR